MLAHRTQQILNLQEVFALLRLARLRPCSETYCSSVRILPPEHRSMPTIIQPRDLLGSVAHVPSTFHDVMHECRSVQGEHKKHRPIGRNVPLVPFVLHSLFTLAEQRRAGLFHRTRFRRRSQSWAGGDLALIKRRLWHNGSGHSTRLGAPPQAAALINPELSSRAEVRESSVYLRENSVICSHNSNRA